MRVLWPDGRSEKVQLRSVRKSGGSGEVFEIEGNPALVAKIYHASVQRAQLAQYERKIAWMIANPPELPPIPPQYQGIVQLAWPLAIVQRDARFTGFVMPKVDFARTMELDYLLSRRQAAAEGFEVDLGKLATVCYNLCSLIDCLHARRIAVVDLKPMNLKVYKSELYVCILDCDGFHITADSFVSEAPQVTPEYLAPEFHGRAVTDPAAQDRFALATIIFRLLNYGIHPYAGIATPESPRAAFPAELAGRIPLHLYPYGRSAHPGVRAIPASVHDCLPDALRELFDRAFGPGGGPRAGAHANAGASAPAISYTKARASARQWASVLGEYANRGAGKLVPCAEGHLHFTGMACPTCRRAGILRTHGERRKRFVARMQASPARAIVYVRKSLKGTHTSPFQATLAQRPLNTVQLAVSTLSIRNVLAIEILWAIGLVITYWWLK
jgi:DNA-binding helix-hairpin-helix protein with protein kinase domain